MTEDEAFIRAVVDSPGDDTPRLVYADFLDDRTDPRGAYLRAEAEWAKRRKAHFWKPPETKPELKAVAALRQQAVSLDTFWVTRVSRPPLGVCCDNLIFTDSGPQLTDADVRDFERRTEGEVPLPLRAFLLNHNGGRPTPAIELPKAKRDRFWEYDRLIVDSFFPLCKRARKRGEKLSWVWIGGDNGPREYDRQLLIGRCGSYGYEIWFWVSINDNQVVRNSDGVYEGYGELPTFLSIIGHRRPNPRYRATSGIDYS